MTTENFGILEKSLAMYKEKVFELPIQKISNSNAWEISMSFVPISQEHISKAELWTASAVAMMIDKDIYASKITGFELQIKEASNTIRNLLPSSQASKKAESREKQKDENEEETENYEVVPFSQIDLSNVGKRTLENPEDINLNRSKVEDP